MTDLPTGSTAGGPTPEPRSAPSDSGPEGASAPRSGDDAGGGDRPPGAPRPRRRGSRGGRNRNRPRPDSAVGGVTADAAARASRSVPDADDSRDPELPDLPRE